VAAPRVLIAEDDSDAQLVMRAALERDGMVVEVADDGHAALAAARSHRVDLVLLDLDLPHLDGLDVLEAVRASRDVPVIIVSGRRGEGDRVLGLELGADDYVVKPFSGRELAARVRSVLRRYRPPVPDVIDHGSLVIDTVAREARRETVPLQLTRLELDLLVVLASNPRRTFTRKELLHLVWESAPEWQDPATVTEHVRRLRQKIEADPERPRWIVTVRGTGYRFEP
jgi:two-component system, OmpR family, phosphate regulon response regulator PhoB